MKKKKRKLKKGVWLLLILVFLFSYGIYYVVDGNKTLKAEKEAERLAEEESKRAYEEKKQKEKEYEACLISPYKEEEKNAELTNAMNMIDNLIKNKNYRASVYFENLDTGLTYKYDAQKVYYGCSLIKLVDALYLINKASNPDSPNFKSEQNPDTENNNNVVTKKLNLDEEKIIYENKYIAGYSAGLAKHKIGDAVSLRDLISYAISVSDNSAHLMLIDYIGFNNLKAYGTSLGGKVILTGGDKFGNQTVEDTNIYLKEAYRIINKDKEYGPFLLEIMNNNDHNAFNKEGINIYHKYGSWDINFHDIGLNLEGSPYAISVFTTHGFSNYKEVIQDIHDAVRKLNDTFVKYRENKCYEEIYNS